MRIIDCIRPDKQTVMFSATFPRQMEALARKILTKPIEVRYFITRMSTLKKKTKKKKQFNRNTNVWFLLKKVSSNVRLQSKYLETEKNNYD